MESELGNRIDFVNAILKSGGVHKGEPKGHCGLIKYKQTGYYNILKDISENVTLVQLMDSLGNVNHDISVVGYWIFESNY